MSDSEQPVLVTGALGNVGRHVVNNLVAASVAVRAADLVEARIRDELGSAVEPVTFNFTDERTWEQAFSGSSVMFLIRPPQLSNIKRDMVPALEAAARFGVTHVVLLSLQGAEGNKVVPHAKIEAWLRESSMTWTFIRPSFFMENLSTTHASDIRDLSEIIVPAGNGRTSFVAAIDVASTASVALKDPAAHENVAYTPTGDEALTYDEVAEILSDVLARPIRYTHPGALRYMRHAHQKLAMPWAMVLVTTAIYTVARIGKAGQTTNDVLNVTGMPPTSLRQWAEDNAKVWAVAR